MAYILNLGCKTVKINPQAELLKRLRTKGKSLKHAVKILDEFIFCITIGNVEMPQNYSI